MALITEPNVLQLSTNFHVREFKCKDGSEVPDQYLCNAQKVAAQLQILRDYLDEPISINSAYRSPEYNAKIGGAKNSQHLLANAADITVKSKTPKQLAAFIEKLIAQKKLAIKGMGVYPGFIHIDCRATKARW